MGTWTISRELVPYPDALCEMAKRVEAIADGFADEQIWLLEHPPLYTAGTSANLAAELLVPESLPVHATGRGGRVTYHGPGQRIAYVMHDLRRRGSDVHAHVARLEAWVIRALADLGVQGERRKGRIGVWVCAPNANPDIGAIGTMGDAKIAALGVHVRRWVTSHGIAINVDPDLRAFQDIVPCGLPGYGITSLRALGRSATMEDLDAALRRHAGPVFGPGWEDSTARG